MLKGYRTIIVNTALMILPVLDLVEVRDVIPDQWMPWYALGMAVANMWLRAVTTTPVGQK